MRPISVCRRVTLLNIERLEERCTPAVTWSVTFIDPGGTHSSYDGRIESNLLAAANDWSRFFPASTASIELGVDFTSTPAQRGGGRSETTSFVGKNGLLDVYEQSIGREIRTGADPNGATVDGIISLNDGYLADELWFDPTPDNR